MATADTTSVLTMLEQLSAASSEAQTANAQAIIMQDQASFQAYLMNQKQGQLMHSPPNVCEWVPTNICLSPRNAKKDGIYLCLPVHMSEASYFKRNGGNEECKDDGYCNAKRLRLKALDRYLAAVSPLALSTRRLLYGASCLEDTKSICQADHATSKSIFNKHHQNRRFKYERQCQTPMHKPTTSNHRLITSSNSGRIINVLQGEIAHCTPSQADILVSDDATTCHIVALRSCYVDMEGENKMSQTANSKVLATMTHIDGPGYGASIRDAVNEHIKYHSMHSEQTISNSVEDCKESCSYVENACNGMIKMSIHIMGGFNDHGDSSIEITDDVLKTFAALSSECDDLATSGGLPRMSMTLKTCAVSSSNDDGTGCPIGRGLAMEVATGNVFLAEVEEDRVRGAPMMVASSIGTGGVSVDGNVQFLDARVRTSCVSAQGPTFTLRSTRLWASAFCSRPRKLALNVIYKPDRDYLCITPFFFSPHPSASWLLSFDDDELLQKTSTSPAVEKPNFASNVRESLNYLNGTKSTMVFTRANMPVKFERAGLNGWIQIN